MSIMSKVLKAPMIILVVLSFLTSVYAVIKGIEGVSIAACVILGLIIVSYLLGVILEREEPKDF